LRFIVSVFSKERFQITKLNGVRRALTLVAFGRGAAHMRLGIIARGIALSEAIRQYARRRLGTALGRYRMAFESVQVRLTDVNGPRGGVDKHCVVEIRGPSLAPIVVRERDANLHAAIDRAAGRVDRTVARRLARNRALHGREPRGRA
jgi:putative sigma-54 modulation protein